MSTDLLIIGAGITGAAAAYEAARRGLSVTLVDKGDIGGATSAATGKLIHGGLRYLKNLELGLVRESLRERRILSTIAPGLVEPVPMVLPDPGWVERLGLTVYDLLSFDRNRVPDPHQRIPAHRLIGAEELAAMGLPHLQQAMLYYDCRMPHPERLTWAFARSARAHGAALRTWTAVSGLTVEGGRVTGATLRHADTGEEETISAAVVLNATGPWAHDLLASTPQTEGLLGERPAVRSEGIYLVTRKLSEVMVLYVTDGGHFSFAPWRGHSLIGPTETAYRGAVDDWRLSRRSIDDFLAHINRTSQLPQPLGPDDVVAAYGGLRPLVESAGEDTYGASRSSEFFDHARQGVEGLLTAAGGKYTTSRRFAEHIVDGVERKLGRRPAAARTDREPLVGCDPTPIDAAIAAAVAEHTGFPPQSVAHLVRYYGTEAPALLDLARRRPALARVLNGDGELLAQVAWAFEHEAATHLEDVVLRRTGLGTLGPMADDALDAVVEVAQQAAGWSDARAAEEADRARRAMALPVDLIS